MRHPELVAQTEEQIEHALGGARVERPRGLVGEQQARLVGERARHGDALALPAGELGAEGARHGRRARPPRAASSARARALAMVHARPDQRNFDVRARREGVRAAGAAERRSRRSRGGREPGAARFQMARPSIRTAARVGLLETADQRSAGCSCPSRSARRSRRPRPDRPSVTPRAGRSPARSSCPRPSTSDAPRPPAGLIAMTCTG